MRNFLTAMMVAGLLGVVGGGAVAQQRPVMPPDTLPAHPRFERLVPKVKREALPQGAVMPTFTYGWTYQNTAYSADMVGQPLNSPGTTISVWIIPVIMKCGSPVQTFSPGVTQGNGHSANTNLLNSPLFKNAIDFKEANTDLGKTQYINAYERLNFNTVNLNPAWHLGLTQTPNIAAAQTIVVPAADGGVGSEFGVTVCLADIGFINGQMQQILANFSSLITPAAVAIFEMYDTYLTQNGGGCCIGGFHSAEGNQTYMQFAYIGTAGAFAQDVSALSHELGEWAQDPFVNNNSPCGLLENGDPLENEANFGGYPYSTFGMTYNLQDLATMPYFGAPPTQSTGQNFTFQGTSLTVCQNGS